MEKEEEKDGDFHLFIDHLSKNTTSQNSHLFETRRSSRENKPKNLSDEWVSLVNNKKALRHSRNPPTINLHAW